jgi:uncharacterized protein YlxW (UPF0749 family)
MDNLITAAPKVDIKDERSPVRTVPKWFWPLTVMTFILGSFIAAALKTQNIVRREELPSPTYAGMSEWYLYNHTTTALQQKTIKSLEDENQVLERGLADRSPETRELKNQLDQYRFLAGLTPVQGPGVTVILRDSDKRPPTGVPSQISDTFISNYIIHDADIQRVVDELRVSGAEAFSVNDQRIVSTTAIRCVGPAIQVNGIPLTPPYVINAIGDQSTLDGAFDLPGGIAETLRDTDPTMITVQKAPNLVLPGYDGTMTFRYCKPVNDTTQTNATSSDSSYTLAGATGQ